ncbi:hypothetical protein HC081234_22830 [Helicobacter cinaedi]|nr:hypothetical protein HC081234_22830 [Helicobacter cinaedi]
MEFVDSSLISIDTSIIDYPFFFFFVNCGSILESARIHYAKTSH